MLSLMCSVSTEVCFSEAKILIHTVCRLHLQILQHQEPTRVLASLGKVVTISQKAQMTGPWCRSFQQRYARPYRYLESQRCAKTPQTSYRQPSS